MTLVENALIITGSLLSILAGLGLLRFNTTFARFHAAGKASPVAFLLIALAVSLQTGIKGSALLLVAAISLIITLPVGIHLLFRVAHASRGDGYLSVDELHDSKKDPDENDRDKKNSEN